MQSLEVIKGSDGTGNANVATVQNTRSPGASTIIVDTVLGINPGGFAGSMGTPHTFTDPITSEVITVISDATAVDFTGHVDGSNLEIDAIAPGYTDAGSAVGDIIIIKPTTQYADNLAEVLDQALEDDGKLKPDALINSPQGTLANVTPVGCILDFAGSSAPAGWLFCYGQSLVRADYGDLFTAIGTTFGAADGTHFNVPDLRGRVAAGKDNMGGTTSNRLERSTTITTTSGSPTATVASATGLAVGMRVVSTNVPAGTTINAISGTTLTLSANATATASTVAARFSMLANDAEVLGSAGGEDVHQLTTAEMPDMDLETQSHSGGAATRINLDGTGNTGYDALSLVRFRGGGNHIHNNVQPTLVLNKIIKY